MPSGRCSTVGLYPESVAGSAAFRAACDCHTSAVAQIRRFRERAGGTAPTRPTRPRSLVAPERLGRTAQPLAPQVAWRDTAGLFAIV